MDVIGADAWPQLPPVAAITAALLIAWVIYRLFGVLKLGAWVSVVCLYMY